MPIPVVYKPVRHSAPVVDGVVYAVNVVQLIFSVIMSDEDHDVDVESDVGVLSIYVNVAVL